MIYKQGNLIKDFKDNKVQILLHQMNCVSNSYAGFAYYLNKEIPIIVNNRCLGTSEFQQVGNQLIYHLYGQYSPGGTSKDESVKFRDFNLNNSLKHFNKETKLLDILMPDISYGMPLIASGLAADKERKGNKTDLEYFKEFIEPIIEPYFINKNLTIYYL